jgi:hypothetical protein
MRSFLFRIFLIGALSAAAVFAQQAEKRAASQAAMPQPGHEMQKLVSVFAGTWSLSETYEPSEWMPSGGVGQGQQIWRAGPGGLSLIGEYHSTSPNGDISGLSVTWWDDKAQGYRATWCVSNNPAGCVVMAKLAKWEGDRFVLGDQFERNGKKFTFREVVSDITSTSFTQTLYQGESAAELTRVMTIRAVKVPSAKKRPS